MGMHTTLKALADPTRREILELLKDGRLSAGEIVEHFSVTGASISRHLSVLKGLLHKNNAARKKSSLTLKLNKMA